MATMEDIYIEKIIEQRDNFSRTNNNLKKMLDDIKKHNNVLKDYWESDVSEETYTGFEKFYYDLEKLISEFDEDIRVLNDSIIEKYKEFEIKVNNKIDNDIAL